MSAAATFATAGITERQLGFWIQKGYVKAPKDGRHREWTTREVAVALLMKRLTDAGVLPARAASVAREVADLQTQLDIPDLPVTVKLDDGLTITISPASQQVAA